MEALTFDRLTTLPELDRMERTLAAGSHLVSKREGYTHHGIYAGNGRVIHYGGFHHSAGRRPIEYVPLRAFAAGRGIEVQAEPAAVFSGAEIVERAKSRLGEDRYRFLTNNCEHFCAWCVLGVGHSEQVRQCLKNPWSGIKMLCVLARAVILAFCESKKRLPGLLRTASAGSETLECATTVSILAAVGPFLFGVSSAMRRTDRSWRGACHWETAG